MHKIVFDTNIWYGLGNGSINDSSLVDLPLITTTSINIIELLTTKNLENNYELVKSAIQKSMLFSRDIIKLSPGEYLVDLINENYFPYNPFVDTLMYGGKCIANDTNLNGKNIYHKMEKGINKVKTPFENLASEATAKMQQMRQNLKEKYRNEKKSKKDFWQEFRATDTKNNIKKLLITHLDPKKRIPAPKFEELWEKIPLFIDVFAYFEKYTVEKGRHIRQNDWFDMFNMVYVQPGDLYSKKDDYWLKAINDIGLGSYLYEFN